MNLKTIAQIFELYARNLTGTRTVLQTLSALAAKLSEDKEFPPRKIIEYWSLILSACVNTGVSVNDITVLVQDYETLFPEQLFELFGNIPFVIEGFRVLKLGDPEKIKGPLAALSVVSILKLRGEINGR